MAVAEEAFDSVRGEIKAGLTENYLAGLLNSTLAEMSEKRLPPRQVAERFLREQPAIWQAWVPADVAERVRGSL